MKKINYHTIDIIDNDIDITKFKKIINKKLFNIIKLVEFDINKF